MALSEVQEKFAEVGSLGTLTLDSDPTPGNYLVAWVTMREEDTANAPNGFTPHPDGLASANLDSGFLSIREVSPGDTATIAGIYPGTMAYVVEISGVDSYEWGSGNDDSTDDPIVMSDVMAGAGWYLGGVVWRTSTDMAGEAIAPTGDTVELNDSKSGSSFVFHPLTWTAYADADAAGLWSVTGDPNGAIVHTWGGRTVLIYAGGDLPEPPPIDPGYTPPEAGHAILEIYVHDEDASRWDVATWGDDDGIVEGSEGEWSGAGWQDVTPEGVTAHVSWGASRPERGILAPQEAQDWLVTTYDPDRRLDPGNVDGPYWPQLVAGVPIRLSSATSGVVIRTGIIDKISYRYKAPEYRGEIRASSTIAYLYRNDVPADASLDNTLRGRLRDAVLTGGIAIGGIPVLGSLDDNYPDIPLSDRIEGAANAWEHISRAGEEVGWVIYEDNGGTLRTRPWGGPMDRGRSITYENLEDLTASVSDDGIYSVVRVLTDDGVTVIERVAAPLPRYGRTVYDGRERYTTINAEAWAAAVLADRAWSGVVWTPGTVWAFDQADVDYFASLEIMERVGLVVPGVLDVSATVLGMELWVEQRTETRARWLFMPRLAVAGSGSLGASILVADDGSGDYLLADDGSGSFLEVDG